MAVLLLDSSLSDGRKIGEKQEETQRNSVRNRKRESEKGGREKDRHVVRLVVGKRETIRRSGRCGGETRGSTFLIQGEAIKMTEPLLARADLYPFTTQRVPDKK